MGDIFGRPGISTGALHPSWLFALTERVLAQILDVFNCVEQLRGMDHTGLRRSFQRSGSTWFIPVNRKGASLRVSVDAASRAFPGRNCQQSKLLREP